MGEIHTSEAISPIDGRYRRYTEDLSDYFSEKALQNKRVEIEAKYLIELSNHEDFPLELSRGEEQFLRNCYKEFDQEDFEKVKEFEKETRHDVKAAEYFINDKCQPEFSDKISDYIHFALTSEDITGNSYASLLKGALRDVMFPALKEVGDKLVEFTDNYKDLPMLARTHGQPASPVTLGKEFGVFLGRFGPAVEDLIENYRDIEGKLNGATGSYDAHDEAFPNVDWIDFSKEFISSLGLKPKVLTDQIKPRDDLTDVFDSMKKINRIVYKLDKDLWDYISRGYFTIETKEDEVGSSTMAHKVNPIKFENSEGNTSKANSDFEHLSNNITDTRLQRDLSCSTLMRNTGVPFAHSLIAFKNTLKGLNKINPHEVNIRKDLNEHDEVLSEAYQTILRGTGYDQPFEVVRDMTMGQERDMETVVDSLDIDEEVKSELKALSPVDYIGRSERLARIAIEDNRKKINSLGKITT